MSYTAEYSNGASSALQHPIKQEFIYEEGCLIKSEVKHQPHAILGEVVFKEEVNSIDKSDTNNYEENIKTDNTVYEGVFDFNSTAACNDNGSSAINVKCWICETDSCEHIKRFAKNITTVKEEAIDDAAQLVQQFNGDQELRDLAVPHLVSQTKIERFCCSLCDYKCNRKQQIQCHIRSKIKAKADICH